MNEEVRKKISTYRRSLEDTKVSTAVYSFLFVVAFIIYGILGAYPLSKVLVRKYNTIKDLRELNGKLDEKNNYLLRMQTQLLSANPYLQGLEKIITPKPAIQNYMVQLVEAAAKSGFKQRSMIIQSMQNGQAALRVSFQGSPEQLGKLIDSIEKMERLSTVDALNYMVREDTANVEISVRIYYLNI